MVGIGPPSARHAGKLPRCTPTSFLYHHNGGHGGSDAVIAALFELFTGFDQVAAVSDERHHSQQPHDASKCH